MKNLFSKSILTLAAGAGLFAIPTTAKADHHVEVRVERREVGFAPRRIWIEPVYEERATQVWVEPVYRTECVPVFVNEYYETKCDRVWSPPVYEVREVVRFERGRRYVSRERMLVRAGGWQNVERRVLVPAHYRNEDRQVLVAPGHFETRTDRVCVREGHWNDVELGVGIGHGRVNFGLGFHF
jgi:hypothetical protein